MKLLLVNIIALFTGVLSFGQNQFHVFPKNHPLTPGTKLGNGSLVSPWDLQTALSQKPEIVNGGDTIWLHGGTYNGRYKSILESTILGEKIMVSGYEKDKVILNGNVNSNASSVFEVFGKNVVYKRFEITFLGNFPRGVNDESFKVVDGLNHINGEDCEFIQLKIHNNPGLGLGFWKHGGASKIEECLIYNNGYVLANGKGAGEGIYTQNISNKTRIIKNNIIFRNYYKGIEVWSAKKRAKTSFVKHFLIKNNVVFNSGLPTGYSCDNLIVATNDRNGVNIARDVKVYDNIFYHNTNIKDLETNGNAPSLTLGFYKKAPIKDVLIENNIIIGRNNALRILYADSFNFKNNLVYSGYVHVSPSLNSKQRLWNFGNNQYFTKKAKAFRFHKNATYKVEEWKQRITYDSNSQWQHIKEFKTKPVLNLFRSNYKSNRFRLVVFDKTGANVNVDFTEYEDLPVNSKFSIINIETDEVISTGNLAVNKTIEVAIGTHNQTNNNFGVFFIDFDKPKPKEKKPKTVLGKFFRWLGF